MIAEHAEALRLAMSGVTGLHTSAVPVEKPTTPHACPTLAPLVNGLSINRSGDELTWHIEVTVSRANMAAQYLALLGYIDPTGTTATSIVAALRADPTLGSKCQGSRVVRLVNIAPVSVADNNYVMAILEVQTWN